MGHCLKADNISAERAFCLCGFQVAEESGVTKEPRVTAFLATQEIKDQWVNLILNITLFKLLKMRHKSRST